MHSITTEIMCLITFLQCIRYNDGETQKIKYNSQQYTAQYKITKKEKYVIPLIQYEVIQHQQHATTKFKNETKTQYTKNQK